MQGPCVTASSIRDGGLCVCSPCIGRGEPYRVDQQLARFIPSSRLARQMRQQSAASCESLDDENQTGASIASLRSATSSSWEMNSWEIDSEEVQICLDSKNRPWQLGSGGFGKVGHGFRLLHAHSPPCSPKTPSLIPRHCLY